MTCRIDRLVTEEDLVIVRISGRITGEKVDMLRAVLEQERNQVAIDLKDVLIVDREAVKLLALSESNGAELRNCPAYIREWVKREGGRECVGARDRRK
jgi:anti-anti-sigma regulatory factor